MTKASLFRTVLLSMIKPGDLVMIADDKWTVPGALTAIRYFQNIKHEYSGKTMIVLRVKENEPIRGYHTAGFDRDIFVLVDGTVKCFTSSLLKVVK